MLYLYSSISCLKTSFPSFSRFVSDGLQYWTLALSRMSQYSRGPQVFLFPWACG